MGKRMKYRCRVLSGLYPYAYGVKRYWGILLLFSSVAVGLDFAAPVLYKAFINKVILKADLKEFSVIVTGYLTIYFTGVFAGYIKNLARYTLVNHTTYHVRLKILRNFWDMRFSDYDSISVGDLKMRIDDDTVQVAEFAVSQTIDLILQYITAAASLYMLFRISWELALFSVVAIPFTFRLDNILSRQERKLSAGRRENNQRTASWLHASVQGWREVKALNLEKHETRHYYQFLHTDMLYNARWINYWTARTLIIPALKDEFFMRFGLYFIGGLLIASGNLHIGDLLVFAVYYSLLSNAIQAVSATDANLQAQMPFVDRLMESLRGCDPEKEQDSALDQYSESIVQDAIFNIPKEKTIIVVAHRESSIRICDRIVNID